MEKKYYYCSVCPKLLVEHCPNWMMLTKGTEVNITGLWIQRSIVEMVNDVGDALNCSIPRFEYRLALSNPQDIVNWG